MNRKEFQKLVKESIVAHEGININLRAMNALVSHMYYFTGQYTEQADFNEYRNFLKHTCAYTPRIPHIAYFHSPVVFHDIIKNLATTRTNKNEDIRLVIEKPFGTNKETATSLFTLFLNTFVKINFTSSITIWENHQYKAFSTCVGLIVSYQTSSVETKLPIFKLPHLNPLVWKTNWLF